MKSRFLGFITLAVTCLTLLAFPSCPPDSDSIRTVTEPVTVWFVDGDRPDDGGDGLSWATAKKTVQAAVDAAGKGEVVFVREGTYTATGADPVVVMKEGVKIYGGFEGYEKKLKERFDPTFNQSILDGGGTCPHVVIGAGHAKLDGFVVTGGHVDWMSPEGPGAGMLNSEVVDLKIQNCLFDNNYSYVGGAGMANDASKLTISNTVFSNNSAWLDGGGAGVANLNESIVDLKYVYFYDNYSYRGGAGLMAHNSQLNIKNNIFISNYSVNRGAGFVNENGSVSNVTDSYFHGNTAYGGGGAMCNKSNSYLSVDDSVIKGNSGFHGGPGALVNSNSSDAVINNCIISGNGGAYTGAIEDWSSSSYIIDTIFSNNMSTLMGAGAISSWNAYPATYVNNCLFVSNDSSSGGGAILTYNTSLFVNNSTFEDNYTSSRGGALYNYYYSTAYIDNSVLWGNNSPGGSDEIYSYYYSYAYVTHSDVYVYPTYLVYPGAGNINNDPLFVTGPGSGVANDYFLSQTAAGQGTDSPCVDAGSDTAANLDLDDKTTRTDGVRDKNTVDMGFHNPRP